MGTEDEIRAEGEALDAQREAEAEFEEAQGELEASDPGCAWGDEGCGVPFRGEDVPSSIEDAVDDLIPPNIGAHGRSRILVMCPSCKKLTLIKCIDFGMYERKKVCYVS